MINPIFLKARRDPEKMTVEEFEENIAVKRKLQREMLQSEERKKYKEREAANLGTGNSGVSSFNHFLISGGAMKKAGSGSLVPSGKILGGSARLASGPLMAQALPVTNCTGKMNAS